TVQICVVWVVQVCVVWVVQVCVVWVVQVCVVWVVQVCVVWVVHVCVVWMVQLIQCKADVSAVNEHGNTPLHYACFWGHDEVAEDLVLNGALVSICSKYGETPLDKGKVHLREILK
ncbi:hypothetical protein scyTo_0023618, partial [Scyliorhinus torazame]|nr:hypothetical protein [Scyliorhinus torazame]